MDLFWKIIIPAAVIVAIGWVGYWIWEIWQRKLEKQRPRQRSQRYQQASSSVADWAKKMAEFEPPKRPKKQGPSDTEKPDSGKES